MNELIVKFADGYTVCYPPCETGIVAYARAASWFQRFPHARAREFSGRRDVLLVDPLTGHTTTSRAERTVMTVVLDVPEPATRELRELCAGIG